MTIELRPLHDDFGIEILNVDLSAGLDDTEFAEIERAVEDYSVVLIKHQNLDDDLQLAFGNLDFLAGQIIGKAWVVLLSIPIIWWLRTWDQRRGVSAV